MIEPHPDVLQEDFTLLARPQPVASVSAASSHPEHSGSALVMTGGIVLAGLALTLVVWRVVRSVQRRRSLGEPADVVALRELAQWRGLTGEARLREAVASVSLIMRHYVERRFGLRAPTLTTEEFWAEQRLHGAMPRVHDSFWIDFLAATDPIKYAAIQPGAARFEALLQAAVSFVKASRATSGRRA